MVRSVDDPNKRCPMCGKYLYEEMYCEKCAKQIYIAFVMTFEKETGLEWGEAVASMKRGSEKGVADFRDKGISFSL